MQVEPQDEPVNDSPDDLQPDLLEGAKKILEQNRRGDYTVPAKGLYPHQWLWDSCFIAIGLARYDVDRAQNEILSLLRGQWSNGMLPHMVMADGWKYRADREMWRSFVSPFAPDNTATSGITQPPMFAEAVVRVGKHLSKPERRSWYRKVYPALVSYHHWLYEDRDPHHEGLTLQVHPWETGLDNTPPWMSEMHSHQLNWWIRLVGKLRLDGPLTWIRRDVYYTMPGQRLSTMDSLGLYATQKRLRRKGYDIDKVLSHSVFAIEDLSFNSILVRANQHLRDIAKELGEELPEALAANIKLTKKALETLWDDYSAQYYSRSFVTHDLIKIPTIATFLPLYAGSISQERADQLASLLKTSRRFHPKYPVPTVPTDSDWFDEQRYWQGPTWVNMNWLIIDGLKRYGHDELAESLAKKTIELVKNGGCFEYFSPIDGRALGAEYFSWTAALTIDLLS
jgi:hypothetical protein